jgi:hypothetical protein
MKLNHYIQFISRYFLGVLISAFALAPLVASETYYTEESQFHTWPDPTAALYEINRFDPARIGLDLVQPSFTMKAEMKLPEIWE